MKRFVRAATLANFEEVALRLGLDPRPVLREAGLDSRVLTDPEMRIPAEAVAALLEDAADRSGCDTFGLQMAEPRRLANFGAISLLIAHQPSLRDALETVIGYRHLVNEALVMDVEEAGDLAVIREEILLDPPSPAPQAYDLAVGALFAMLRDFLGPRWRAASVNLSRPAPSRLDDHRRVFGLRIHFGAEFNGLVVTAGDMVRPNPAADASLAQYARKLIDTVSPSARTSMTHEVRRAAYLMMPSGKASIAMIAQSLGLHVRVLQRRLAAEQSEFSEILTNVRRELAVRYLANPTYSVTQTSLLLGYGQPSSFTRWFIAEFGVGPTAWRNAASSAAGQATPWTDQ